MAKKKVYAVRKGKKGGYFFLGMNVNQWCQDTQELNTKDLLQKQKLMRI